MNSPASAPLLAARGALTVEQTIPAGARLRVTAWPRTGPDGAAWLSLLLSTPRKGRVPRRRLAGTARAWGA